MTDALLRFSPPVRTWFAETFGQPTPPQAAGWPAIQRGDHTLILAPTGSGKTLSAFLWGIDAIYRELTTATQPLDPGVRLLYISPLKALNNDIERNLRVPLAGIGETAARLHEPSAEIRVLVRTGDTPAKTRAAMVRRPPHILITTPESLYLILTSPRAREMFRTVETVIVDEIHTLCGNKRGAHLALSLERLEHLAQGRVQRIGLSATIRPLEEAARFLGGQECVSATGAGAETIVSAPAPAHDDDGDLRDRPVTIVDTGYRKPLDLEVVTVVDDFREMPAQSVWPSVIPQVLADIMRHRTTLVFCNNRRLAERTADRLNAQIEAERSEEIEPGSTEALAPGGIMRDRGMFGLGVEGPIRAHHGSMSREAREEMETDLKAGRLPALVGTSSLELGIDIGAVDLVVQLQSPKSVSQGLQRVGRAGHLVGQTSHGRIYATFREDLVEAAAVVRGMLDGDVEKTLTPRLPLDVLAQQIVAMVAVESWPVEPLYRLVRQAYPYRELPRRAFLSVLEMLSGRYQDLGGPARKLLRPRLDWDHVNGVLNPLPGSRLLAVSNPGTIADTGAFDVYLQDGTTRLGALDEEFVFETHAGDVFTLGSSVWRVTEIRDDRVVVEGAPGETPRMPFWKGDYPWRQFELGARIGRLRAEIADRLRAGQDEAEIVAFLRESSRLDLRSALNLLDHIQRQLDAAGALATDRSIIVESFEDDLGEGRVVIHSSFGGRINGAWSLAIRAALHRRTGLSCETQVTDDGILLRVTTPSGDAPGDQAKLVAGILRSMTFDQARDSILAELPASAMFGSHFRTNAARALLLPRARAGQRMPLWLQRLRAKDLLAAVRNATDFPILVETYRDCLLDVLDMPHLQELLDGIVNGAVSVHPVESIAPSPLAAELLYNFTSIYMYEDDTPKAERQLRALSGGDLLSDLLHGIEAGHLLRPEAVDAVTREVEHLGPDESARSPAELAGYFAELGDLTTAEATARAGADAATWIEALRAQGRIVEVSIPAGDGEELRWAPADRVERYRQAWAPEGWEDAAEAIVREHLRSSGPLTVDAIRSRYRFPFDWLVATLDRWVEDGQVVRGHLTPSRGAGEVAAAPAARPVEYCDRYNLEQIHRRTLAILRREIQPVSLDALSAFLARWQHVHPETRVAGDAGVEEILGQLRGVALPGTLWEREILPARAAGYRRAALAERIDSGGWVWAGQGAEPKRMRIRWFERGEGRLFLRDPEDARPSDRAALKERAGLSETAGLSNPGGLSETARDLLDFLREEGASFLDEIVGGVDWPPESIQPALAELAARGLVTSDSLDAMDLLLAWSPPAPTDRRTVSSVANELAALRQGKRPTRGEYYAARRRVGRRLGVATPGIDLDAGRWSPLHRSGILGRKMEPVAIAAALTQVLLARYGIVVREWLAREDLPVDWGAIYAHLQRMELRGQVRRGYFVAGLSGMQYALPEAVEQLRAASSQRDGTPIVLSAVDPANILDLLPVAPDAEIDEGVGRFARIPSTHCVMVDGRMVLLAEDSGRRMTIDTTQPDDRIVAALEAYLGRPGAEKHVVVNEWNGRPALGGEGEAMLKKVGFYRMPTGLEWWSAA